LLTLHDTLRITGKGRQKLKLKRGQLNRAGIRMRELPAANMEAKRTKPKNAPIGFRFRLRG
jgi:hypothetical protein